MRDLTTPESGRVDRLADRLRAGDPDALAECYELYKRLVYGYCLRTLNDHGRAEDATHNTFMKVRQGVNSLEDASSLCPWILRIARNEALQTIRRENWYSDEELKEEDFVTSETPALSAERSEQSEIVDFLLKRLSEGYREVLVLREYLDLSYKEISEVTGDSVSAVKSKIHKARRRMTELYRTHFERGIGP